MLTAKIRDMTRFNFPEDAFGDPFELASLPLPRTAIGYAVQRLGTDTLLDQHSGDFLPVRAKQLQGLFKSFDDAHSAASRWVVSRCATPEDHGLAIVPASFDQVLYRHVLIYGVLCGQP